MSSTTRTSGLSSVAASTALRNAPASRSGMTSADHSTGLGTPGKTLKSSGDTRDSSLSACALVGTGRRSATLPQQVRHTYQVRARLRSQLLAQSLLESGIGFERVGAVADPGARLHQAADRVFGQGIELVQHLGVPLHRGEIADAAPGVHLLHQAVADPRAKPRPPLVRPLLEPGRGGPLEAVEKRSPDLQVAGIQMRHVG